MIFMTVDPTVIHEAIISLRDGTELPPFRIEGPGGDHKASGRVIRVTRVLADHFEIETESPLRSAVIKARGGEAPVPMRTI